MVVEGFKTGFWEFVDRNFFSPHREGRAGCLAPFLIVLGCFSLLGFIIFLVLFIFDISYLLRSEVSPIEPYVENLRDSWHVVRILVCGFVGCVSFVYGIKAGKSPEIDRVAAERDLLQQQLALNFGDKPSSIKGQSRPPARNAKEDER